MSGPAAFSISVLYEHLKAARLYTSETRIATTHCILADGKNSSVLTFHIIINPTKKSGLV